MYHFSYPILCQFVTLNTGVVVLMLPVLDVTLQWCF